MCKYVIYAGVNGAGKSTLYQTNGSFDLPRINMDEIVRSFGSWTNPKDVIKAGKIAARLLKEYIDNGVSFNQETTLCGKSTIKNIIKAKDKGYSIDVYYVGLGSVDIAKERVKKRVADGGHGVSDEDIERRYAESFEKLIEIIPICDSVQIFDNSESFKKVAIIKQGRCIKLSAECPGWCIDILKKSNVTGTEK